MSSRLLVADISAVIFPLSAIDPVLSSTSATRSRLEPHLAVDELLTVIMLYPMTPRKTGGDIGGGINNQGNPAGGGVDGGNRDIRGFRPREQGQKIYLGICCASRVIVSVAFSFAIISGGGVECGLQRGTD